MIRSELPLPQLLLPAFAGATWQPMTAVELLPLPPVVNECLFGLSHAVRIIAALDGRALLAVGVHKFGGQALGHRAALTGACRGQNPSHGQGKLSRWPHLQRNLVGSTTHAAGTYLQRGHDPPDGAFKHMDGVFFSAVLCHVQRFIHDALGGALLAALHEHVDQRLHPDAVVLCVGRGWTADYFTPARHESNPRSLLRTFSPARPVLATLLLAAAHAQGVQRPPNDVVAHAGQVLHATTAD